MRNVLIASLLAAASTAMPPAQQNVAPAFETFVEIVPTATKGYPLTWQDPPTYTCSATVLMPPPGAGSGRTAGLKVDNLVVRPGHRQTKSVSGGGYDAQMTVKVDAAADRAEATVTLLREGQILTRQNTTVWLGR